MLNKVQPPSALSAAGNSVSSGTVVFSNSNGVTFGMAGSTVTASVAPGGAGLSAGTQSVNTGTVAFVNSNGVTFGMSGSSQITASYTVPSTAGLISNINVSAGSTSNNLSAVTFSNSNGVSFGLNGSVVTATVATNYQSQGAYLTTAMQSNAATISNINVSAGTTSGNLSALTFSNGSGVSFGLNASTITASVAAQTAQTQNCVDATLAGNSTSVGAGYVLISSGTMTWAGGNNITLSQNGNAITISGANAGGAQTGISGIVASNTTFTSGTVSFSNLGNITISQSANGATQYIQLSGNAAQTVQTQNCLDATLAGNSTSAGAGYVLLSSGTATWAGGNNITLSQNGNAITISAANAAAQTNQSGNVYASSNTFGTSSGTYDARSLSIAGSGIVSVAASNSGWIINATTAAQTNQSGNVYASSNTFGTSSGTYDARSLSIAGSGIVSVAASNSGWVINATTAAQSAQTDGFYAIGNSTVNSSTTLDARTVSFAGAGAISIGFSSNSGIIISGGGGASQSLSFYAGSNTYGTSSGTGVASALSIHGNGALSVAASNSGWELSVPQTSSLSATGWISISTNGSTISIGASTTMNLYAVGNTFGTSSGTADMRSISISGVSGIQVAGSNSGWVIGEVPNSVLEPFPILTGTAYSSHAPASWWFNRVLLIQPMAFSNVNVIKSLNVGTPADTAAASSGKIAHSYSHGLTVFSRQDYGAHSSNLTTVTTASIGFTASISYTSGSVSAAYSWVTDTTGGTTSFSTSSNGVNWSNNFSGPFVFQIPCLTTLQPGEYFFAHAHSSTSGTSGNSNFTLMSMSNLHIAPQVVGPLQTLGQSVTQASLNPWGMGGGIASAVTTNNSMPGSVISGQTQNNIYMALSNA